MKWTCIIASAAYSVPELIAQFGPIPPSFLPVGNNRLFQLQYAALPRGVDQIILSLPEDFQPDASDLERLHEYKIDVVHVPNNLSLGDSIAYVQSATTATTGRLSILHGDTLLEGVDFSVLDGISVGDKPPIYQWGAVYQKMNDFYESLQVEIPYQSPHGHELGKPDKVLSGWFSFNDASLFAHALVCENGDFVKAVGSYARQRNLRKVSTGRWLDFGHAITFDQSRRRFKTERHFNHLESTKRTVIKSGKNNRKIEAEAQWFEKLPLDLRIHTPAFLGRCETEASTQYIIEYLHLPTLTELFVFGRQSRDQWKKIFDGCGEFLSGCASHPAPPSDLNFSRALYADKTLYRLENFARTRNIDIKAPCRYDGVKLPSLEQIVHDAAAAIPSVSPQHVTLVHGDFCFSNILYDLRAELVRVIDPRGLDGNGAFSNIGDLRYDLGKLYHSVIGRYDHIVAGYFKLQKRGTLDMSLELPDSPLLRDIELEFLGSQFAGLTPHEAAAPSICVLLFLSMLPLHSDDTTRQDALLANALRMFVQLERQKQPRSYAA